MTTLAKMLVAGGPATERQVASPPGGTRGLVTRLHEECERQVPFSQTKLLLREAASAIERLEADVAGMATHLAAERATRQAP